MLLVVRVLLLVLVLLVIPVLLVGLVLLLVPELVYIDIKTLMRLCTHMIRDIHVSDWIRSRVGPDRLLASVVPGRFQKGLSRVVPGCFKVRFFVVQMWFQGGFS